MEPQRVVVIQDASREVSSSAIKWALQGMSLRPGDTLTLLSVLHQVNNPSMLSFMGARKPSKKSFECGRRMNNNKLKHHVSNTINWKRKRKEQMEQLYFIDESWSFCRHSLFICFLIFLLVSVGYKIRVDTSMFGANHKIVEEEVAKKKEEYQNNEDLTQLSKLYQMKQVITRQKLARTTIYICLEVLW